MQKLKLDQTKGYDKLPVMLMPSSFDAKPTIKDHEEVTGINMKMPLFCKLSDGEKDRQNLLTLLSANQQYAQVLVKLS